MRTREKPTTEGDGWQGLQISPAKRLSDGDSCRSEFRTIHGRRSHFNGPTNGGSGQVIRRTHTDYRTDYNNPQASPPVHLRSLPSQQIIYDASNNIVAQTQYVYDEANTCLPSGGTTPCSYGGI